MNKLQDVHLVTGLHGNEPMPILALASQGITQLVANPRALAQRVRYIETDMNAAFGVSGNLLEEKRAREFLPLLEKNVPVIDFHTFSCVSEPFGIVVDLEMVGLAKQLGLSKVVYMKHNVKEGHALINYRKGVSVEVGKHTDPTTFAKTLDVVKSYQKGKLGTVEVFEVFGIIEKEGNYKNFELHKEGFYPVLAGEKAYNHFGLMARRLDL